MKHNGVFILFFGFQRFLVFFKIYFADTERDLLVVLHFSLERISS